MRFLKIIRLLIFSNKLVVIKLTIMFFDCGTNVKSLFNIFRFKILFFEFHHFYYKIVDLHRVSMILGRYLFNRYFENDQF